MKITLLIFCLVSLALPHSAPAKGAKMVRVHAAGPKITAISADSISVEVAKATHIYRISGKTTIRLDGMKASVKDLKSGMSATVVPSQLDPRAAMAIEASSGN